MRVLAADVGGTKTLVALGEAGPDGHPRVLARRRYASAEWPDLAPLLTDFLDREAPGGRPAAGCIAVAGPVTAERGRETARVTNLPWTLDSAGLATALGIGRLRLVNDFVALAHGLDALAGGDLETLQAGRPERDAPGAVIGAGTGLGMATVVALPDGRRRVLPSEGGHADFAPADAAQAALAEWLRPRLGRVSVEHVLSGPGLVRILEFLAARAGRSPGEALARAMREGDPAAAIGEAALAGSDPLAVEAVALFTRIYGARAGDLALAVLPRAGLYVAGGIAPRLAPLLRSAGFMDAFRAKPPMEALMAAIPVHLVRNPDAGLLGALALALEMAG